MIELNTEICTNFEKALSREWLETNGIGGFASSTVSGANSRRYHGLLTAATRPPLGRVVLLSKFEETLRIGDRAYELSANQYPNSVHPQGFKFLKSFRLDPFPIWTFAVEDLVIEKKIFMVHGENTTVCRWTIVDGIEKHQAITDEPIIFELKPLLAFRDYHHLRQDTMSFKTGFEAAEQIVSVAPDGDFPALFFAHNAVAVERTGYWYRDFEYALEKERGFDYHENLYQPFAFEYDLLDGANVVVSTQVDEVYEVARLEAREIARREELIVRAGTENRFRAQLVLAADQFIVARGDGRTVIAGYPWFSDWGRDTMISLAGLTIATNRTEIARQILLEFSKHLSEGMLPNRFPDAGDEAEYNTVDATLWYFEAIRAYVEKTNDYDFVRENLYEKLAETVAWHVRGTRYGIRAEPNGLLHAGEPGVQLTWMDAKIGDWVVTPRTGKPVEIQALWYNALKVMADFALRFGDEQDRQRYESMAEQARQSFNEIFWNDAEDCLFDVVTDDGSDGAVRPNQIFAVSLPHSMLSIGQAQKIVEKVERELLTPVGLRSLSPKDKDYRSIYTGSPFDRDSAYHQGTVWGWLIGAFIDAYRRVYPNGHQTENRVNAILAGFEKHLYEAGLGQISEIFDAAAPHSPRGCMAQAWSVAEVLRILSEKS
ncbi:MAG: glycogen debranching enzyme family protein [Acidobacteria bacterium]|nr:glycogen debranching enzyme family protein [Acidobacteriota bacterium]